MLHANILTDPERRDYMHVSGANITPTDRYITHTHTRTHTYVYTSAHCGAIISSVNDCYASLQYCTVHTMLCFPSSPSRLNLISHTITFYVSSIIYHVVI